MKWVGLLLAGLVIAGGWWYVTLPDGSEFIRSNPKRTAMMRDREANGIQARPIAWVPLSRIAPALRRAVIVAEDANFYRHRGIDWEATWSALEQDWRERRFSRGGSTITQQLTKNLYLDPHKTIWRKGTEAVIAMKMERQLSKSRLLELYLNVVEWGRGVYGAEAAARRYFGKPAAELTIEEASWLAAILPSPLRYEQHPRARLVTSRASIIKRYVERQLAGQAPPPAPPQLPPLPADEEEPADPSLSQDEEPPSAPPEPPQPQDDGGLSSEPPNPPNPPNPIETPPSDAPPAAGPELEPMPQTAPMF
ncbi:MAG: monofunctional biosynthetic peptidoglycan transglycosylase [Nitrospirae bacterium]|nr:monofunctional biosynthetic peptidoglycan transglycosylase [Nitrospirota bacterium]